MLANIFQHHRKLYISQYYADDYIENNASDLYELVVNRKMVLPLFIKDRTPLKEKENVFCFEYAGDNVVKEMHLVVLGRYTMIYRNICRSLEWQNVSINISELKDALRYSISMPNIVSFELYIIPYPTSPAVKFKIRNLRFRPYNSEERQKAKMHSQYQLRKSQPHINLNNYLYHIQFLCELISVKVGKEHIGIKGYVCDAANEFFLYEIPVFAEFAVGEFVECCKIEKAKDGFFEINIPRFTNTDDYKYDRLYSRWCVCTKSSSGINIASQARYADESESNYSIPTIIPNNKKGLGGFKLNEYESDLDELNISYITVNIRINNFLRFKPDGENTIEFEYGRQKYYADKRKITEYDAIMQAAAKRNIIVYAIILIYPENRSKDIEVGRLLENPEYDTEGAYTMPNITNIKAANAYAAALDFIASRYGRADKLYGHIHGWIAHNEIDTAKIWANAGSKTALELMDIYVKSMRMIYYIARKYNGNAEVFIPLTHNWTVAFDKNSFPAKEMLDLLLKYSITEGDFQWGIAYHPYPEELWEPKSWLDRSATDDIRTTKMITFKNVELLDKLIKQPRMLYTDAKGAKHQRTMILSEQNPNSFNYTTPALREQAESLEYVCRKVAKCNGIKAYIAHSWIDARFEGGLKTGLRKYPDDKNDPYGKKPAWHIYKQLEINN